MAAPVATLGAAALYPEDLATLAPGAWLNDAVVTYFIEALLTSSPSTAPPGRRVIMHPAAVYCTLLDDPEDRPASLKGLSLTPGGVELLLVPVNDGMASGGSLPGAGTHWALLAFSLAEGGWRYFDSGGSALGGPPVSAATLAVADAAAAALHPLVAPPGILPSVVIVPGVPRQGNAYDCGLHLCARLAALWRGSPSSLDAAAFTPAAMTALRSQLLQDVRGSSG